MLQSIYNNIQSTRPAIDYGDVSHSTSLKNQVESIKRVPLSSFRFFLSYLAFEFEYGKNRADEYKMSATWDFKRQ